MKTCRSKLHTYSESFKQCPECRNISELKWENDHKDEIKTNYKTWKSANRDKTRAHSKKWSKANRAKMNAYEANRRAAKLYATPKWLTKEQLKEIQSYYELAKELQWLSEEPLEVDHIVPLQGKNVSGLHVPWNLQILPESLNCRKSNYLGL